MSERGGGLAGAGLGACFAALTGCSDLSGNLAIQFESQALEDATVAVTLFAVERQRSGADTGSCQALLGPLSNGQMPTTEPIAPPLELPFDEIQIGNFPAGAQTVLLIGLDGESNRIAVGCSEGLNSDEGQTEIKVLMRPLITIHSIAQMRGGNLQVGRPGAALPIRLEVQIIEGRTHALPGVPVVFTPAAGVILDPPAQGESVTVFTDVMGLASVAVTLPPEAGQFEIIADAKPLYERVELDSEREREEKRKASILTFAASAVEAPEPSAATPRSRTPRPARFVAMAVGRPSLASRTDLVVLGCEGSEGACTKGSARTDPFGEARLTMFEDLANGSSPERDLGGAMGLAPAGLVVGPLGFGPLDQIAMLEGRSTNNERGFVRIASADTGALTELATLTVSASNAVDLIGFSVGEPNQRDLSLLIAAQGTSRRGSFCHTQTECILDYDDATCLDLGYCGCRPDEACVEMDGLRSEPFDGVCVAQDKELELHRNLGGGSLQDPNACASAVVACPRTGSPTCGCADNPAATCGGDSCGCPVPDRIDVGPIGGVPPLTIASGHPLTVAGTVSGLAFFRPNGDSLEQLQEQLVGELVTKVVLADLTENGDDDVVWVSSAPCRPSSCPLAGAEDPVADGCLGIVAVADGKPGACRSFAVRETPISACGGDFNGDGHVDIALSTKASTKIRVYSGGGHGGIEDPPFLLDTGLREPTLTCADVDGDSVSDLIALSSEGLAVFRSR